jgi:hypothetical protein
MLITIILSVPGHFNIAEISSQAFSLRKNNHNTSICLRDRREWSNGELSLLILLHLFEACLFPWYNNKD